MNLAEFWERKWSGCSGPSSSLQFPREIRQIHRTVKTEGEGEFGRWECLVSRASLQIARSHLQLLAEHFPKLSNPLPLPDNILLGTQVGISASSILCPTEPKFQSSLSLAHTRGVCLGLPGLLLVCFNSPLLDATADWELIGSRDLVSLWKVKTILFLNKQSHKI